MENLRTLNLSEKKDPVRDLWRNVLIVAIEDVIKKATVSARFSHYYKHTNKSALEYFEIPNRDHAIRHAISKLNQNDLLLIAGKGHETLQTIGTETLPFDDYTVAKEAIKNVEKIGVIN